ncbi:DUF3846 domain-containing protein [Mycolicibacter icosiumassiliensis]|uniref:DUF3846 domain-containing protein n=1 Tax=Mycolicibacter icosiumassiliensis TaxID=1792835 RepID=UPI0008302BF1|nr:DUF3846 domain-containing protein [Mycolicibacter icosiumassiliensis]
MTDTRIDAIVLYHDASSEYPPYPTKVAPTIELYQQVVKGYIEAVHLELPDGTRAVMYVNEEGRIHALPINPLATSVARQLNRYFADPYILGNAIIVGVRECDDADAPPAITSAVQSIHTNLRIAGYVQTLRGQGRQS